MHCDKKHFSHSKVYTWTSEPARLNSCFPGIVVCPLPSAPASRPVSQDTRKWKRAAHDQIYMCNPAAAFSRYLTKVKDNMVLQLNMIQGFTSKGKSSSKLHQAADGLDYLITFNQSITQAMASTMQDLSDGVCINVSNLTLARTDSDLEYIKAGIKQDTLASLKTAPLDMSMLFPDDIIAKAEEEIQHHKCKHSTGTSHRKPQCFHPTVGLPDSSKILTGSLLHQNGSRLERVARDLTGATGQDTEAAYMTITVWVFCSWQVCECFCDQQRNLYCKLCNWKQELFKCD